MSIRFIDAKHLRRFTAIAKLKSERTRQGTDSDVEEHEAELRREFMSSTYSDDELESLLAKIVAAAKAGEFEFEVMEFPASYCTDNGRAVNNDDPKWPQTLQGRAKSFYEQWEKHGKPHGYRLKVKVLSYPDGFIGDVGLYLDWSS